MAAFPSAAYAATCGVWAPQLTASTTGTAGSKAVTIGSAGSLAGPGSCTNSSGGNWAGTHHVALVRKAGATPPSAPTDGTTVYAGGAFASKTDYVQRSNKEYSYAIFACSTSTGCGTWYAGDAARVNESIDPDAADDNKATVTTQVEIFRLKGVTGEADTSHYIVKSDQINAPDAFFYPDGFLHAGGLAMYSSTDATSTSNSLIYYQRYTGSTDSDGWPTAVNSSASWTTKLLVAEGDSGAGADHQASHVWTMFTDDGTDALVHLFAQSQWAGASSDEVVQLDAVNDIGDDFDLGCGSGACTDNLLDVGTLAMAATASTVSPYVRHFRHGRVVWDYIANGPIVPGTDEPVVLVTSGVWSGVGCSSGTAYDDLVWLDGTWSGTRWDWDLWTTGGSPDCPEIMVADAHDPALLPLPGGEYKMYYRSSIDGLYHVVYWDGTDWVDDTTIEFYWDTGSTGPDDDCINNLSAAVRLTPIAGGAKEGLFFRLWDSDHAGCGTGVDDDTGGGPVNDEDGAIVFAQLDNG